MVRMWIIGFLRAGRQLVYETKILIQGQGTDQFYPWPWKPGKTDLESVLNIVTWRRAPDEQDVAPGMNIQNGMLRFRDSENPTLDRVVRLLAETAHEERRRANQVRSVDESEPAAVIPKASCSRVTKSGYRARMSAYRRQVPFSKKNWQNVLLPGRATCAGRLETGACPLCGRPIRLGGLPFVTSPCPPSFGVCLVLALARPCSAWLGANHAADRRSRRSVQKIPRHAR